MGLRRSATRVPTRRTIGVTALAAFALGVVMPGIASAGETRNIGILDRCDPASFNAMFGDGTCVMRNGGVSVGTFLERVNPKDGGHNAWRFTPGQVRLTAGSRACSTTAVARCIRSRKSSTSAAGSCPS
jgi:hypothetical protein